MPKVPELRLVDILGLGGVAFAAVGTTDVFYSECFPVEDATYSFEYLFTSGGNVKVKVQLEQSNVLPETEGSADGNFVVPDGALELDDECADEVVHIKAYAPAATLYARVKVTGLATNDASTVLSRLRMAIAKTK